MSNVYTYQVLKDTTEQAIIKLTGKFDGTGQEANTVRIQANTLSGALDSSKANLLSSVANTGPLSYYGLTLMRVWYTMSGLNSDLEMTWTADTGKTIMLLSGTGEYDATGQSITIPNNAAGTANCFGDIGFSTRGMAANNSYTVVMELRKDNAHYQRGQFNDPAAFNYGDFGLRP